MAHNDPEKRRQRDRERYARNREERSQYNREYYARRKALDPEYQRDTRRAWVEKNRDKTRAAARKYTAGLSPEQRWAETLRRHHGMYPAQWQAMWDEQHGKCYLCLEPLPENRKLVHVDHDHGHCPRQRSCSLCRRGLACGGCNLGIGAMGDSPERLRIAADNLERAQAMVKALMLSAPQQESLF